MRSAAALVAFVAGSASGTWPVIPEHTLPQTAASYLLNRSTIIMPCNYTGFTDPETTKGWAVVDFDWSNAIGQGTAEGWAKHRPMDDEEMLFEQVKMTTNATPGTTVWVYRNTVYGYPWYTSVRKTLDDPAYRPWYMKFAESAKPWYSDPCDKNDPTLCSDLYHSQYLVPGYPSGGWGTCAAPGCDCGTQPCGFYVWNHSSDAVVYNQTFQEWFVHSYMLNEVGMSPLVSGFFWDDIWDPQCYLEDQVPRTCEDMGLTQADLLQQSAAYYANMEALKKATLALGKFSWQMLWTGGAADNFGQTDPAPLVANNNATLCAATFRSLCTAGSAPQTRAMMFPLHGIPEGLLTSPDLMQDIASFLLLRGDYAYIGWAWMACSRQYPFPDQFHADYGTPQGLCAETAVGSGVFTREYTKATIQLNCNTWAADFAAKE